MSKRAKTSVPAPECVRIRGARQNNLKGFDLDLPLGRLNVITGPSGCGKSSLAFDTIYAEGQRRYAETFSPYTRQFLERMDKPRVDEILGIPPAIAIEQANNVRTSRSTVGTITEINDYLKLLMPRIAQGFCPECNREIRPETARSIVETVLAQHAGVAALVTFPVAVPSGTKPADFFKFLQQQGWLRVWLENEVRRTDEPPKAKRLPALVEVVQDRITIAEENRSRLTEAVESGLRLGAGKLKLVIGHLVASDEKDQTGGQSRSARLSLVIPFSRGWHCAHCDIEITPPSPSLFSFNNPVGACPKCRGFGRMIGIDLERAIPDRSLSIAEGVVRPFQSENGEECQRDLMRQAKRREVDVKRPFEELPQADQEWVLLGDDPRLSGEELWKNGRWYGVRGFFDWLETKAYKMHIRVLLSRYRNYTTCVACNGGRFQPATLNFRVGGKTLPQLAAMPAGELHAFFSVKAGVAPNLSGVGEDSATRMLCEAVTSRLHYLVEVGLGYLSLDRQTRTLSGGELERVNLTACLGASLVNTLFVLDEPTVGLHPRDVARMVRVMQGLRDKGNTLLVVEHDEAVMHAADNMIELGPGRGEAGGDLVFHGTLDAMLRGAAAQGSAGVPPALPWARSASLTADYLTGRKSIPVPKVRRDPKAWLKVAGAREHNLQRINVEFPLGVFTCVTGVSGSGKSTLVTDVLYRNLARLKGEATEEEPGACKALTGAQRIRDVVLVDQSPLAKTPRSNPAAYLGVFDFVRENFSTLPEALAEGLTAGSFSFNSGRGRCERCSGNGFEKVEMQFLSDVYVRCPECEGRRYQPHVLKIRLRGKSIHDVLEMTVTEAIRFFEDDDRITRPLKVLEEVGLGYLRLGQPLNVLSGGESQRLKLIAHLAGKSARKAAAKEGPGSLLIFDEPTTGLHFDDIALLLGLFQRLVEEGNTVLVIEHNLEVIKCADHVIDLGPEAGADGGLVVAQGTPEEVAKCERSHTGRFLRGTLQRSPGSTGCQPVVSGSLPETCEAASVYNIAGEQSLRVAESPSGWQPDRTGWQPVLPGTSAIQVLGAREHNLKNISLAVPRDRMVVVTGVSGSGKSTLAFDILFAEGQRRFLDSMSPYARQFAEQLEKPEVDLITGLPPTVAIEQRVTRGGGKSTVATVTEVYHFLRLLFAKLGTQFCPECNLPVEKQSTQSIVKQAAVIARGGGVRVLAPLVKGRKGFHTDVAKAARKQGFETLFVDGRVVDAADFKKLERFKEHTIDGVAGFIGPGYSERRIAEAVLRALDAGHGTAKLLDRKGRVTILSTEMSCSGCGQSFEPLDPRLFSFNSPHGWCTQCRGFGEIWHAPENARAESVLDQELFEERHHEWLEEGEAKPCPSCAGVRLNEIARSVRLQEMTIADFVSQPVRAALERLDRLKFAKNDAVIARDLIPEIRQRLEFMGTVGLDYLSLDRSAKTLSGGESQRIRLAAQLGSNLRGVLYVLDEPTIGLHPRDNQALLGTLEALKEKGNSLLIVEHDEDTMRRADTIIDLGPGAGSHGGTVVATGTLAEIQKIAQSATGRFLREPVPHPSRGERRKIDAETNWLELCGATANNLKNIHARIPVGKLTVLAGVSGSGKSTLMRTVLKPAVEQALKKPRTNAKAKEAREMSMSLRGSEFLEAVYEVDQSPIGKTSRSTPATYVKVFDEIRKLFAQLPLARMRGYSASRFSFNTEGGRCETCAGQGVLKIEMNFLPPSYVPCPDCHGRRYNAATLEVLYNDRSIGDVTEMTIEQAAELFAAHPAIRRPLALLCDTGLGYLKLGQPSPTLSGGEAQRLKLVTELVRGVSRTETARIRRAQKTKSVLYLLEEPTIGLHMADVAELLRVMHRLVDDGHTVVVIEHNLDVIADADFVIEIGPEAGAQGGEIVASGTPEEVAKSRVSRTAPFLREVLKIAPAH